MEPSKGDLQYSIYKKSQIVSNGCRADRSPLWTLLIQIIDQAIILIPWLPLPDLTRLANDWHTISIRLAARIWGETRRHYWGQQSSPTPPRRMVTLPSLFFFLTHPSIFLPFFDCFFQLIFSLMFHLHFHFILIH